MILLSQADAEGIPIQDRDLNRILQFYISTGLLTQKDGLEIMRQRPYIVRDETALEKILEQKVSRRIIPDRDKIYNLKEEIGRKDGAPFDSVPEIWRIRGTNRKGKLTFTYGVLVPGSAVMTNAQKLEYVNAFGRYLWDPGKKCLPRLFHWHMIDTPPSPESGLRSYLPDRGNELPYIMLVEPTKELLVALEYGQGHANLLPKPGLLATLRDALRTTLIGVYRIQSRN